MRAELGYGADQHPARPRHWIVELPALADDPFYPRGDATGVPPAVSAHLPPRRGIDVQNFYVDRDLVGAQWRRDIEPPRLLREDTGWLQRAMDPKVLRVCHADVGNAARQCSRPLSESVLTGS